MAQPDLEYFSSQLTKEVLEQNYIIYIIYN